ncbi:MAG: hypothetical protein ACXW3G_01395, partial [Rhodoplanes sp.]
MADKDATLYHASPAPPIRTVIAGLDPAIHLSEMAVLSKMDTRVKPAYDESLIAIAGITARDRARGGSVRIPAQLNPDRRL